MWFKDNFADEKYARYAILCFIIFFSLIIVAQWFGPGI